MLTSARLILFSLLAACFTGCSSVPMPKGSSKGYSSVRFVTPNAPLGTDNSPKFVEANRMIKTALTAQLDKNGLSVVEGNADLIVAYLIILQDNTSTAYSNQYYGLQDYSGIVAHAHKKGTQKEYPEAVQKRALIIDLIDAKTYKLVYRNYALSGMLSQLPEQEQQEQVDNLVARTLQQFFR